MGKDMAPFKPLPPSRRPTRPQVVGAGLPGRSAADAPVAPAGAGLKPARPNPRRSRAGCFALLFLLVLLAAGGLIAYQFYSFYGDRISPGVRVFGEDVGGMTRDLAEARLQEKLGDPNALLDLFGGEQLTLRDGSKTYRAWPWELGFRSDFKPALDAAMAIGHRGNLATDVPEMARAFWFGADISISSAFDQETARAYLSLLAPEIDRPPRDSQLRLDGLRVIEVPGAKGRQLDVEETLNRIKASVLSRDGGEIAIAVAESDPQTTDTTAARDQITRFLRAPLLLTFGDRAWAIDQATLASLISIRPAAAENGTIKLAATLNHAALADEVKVLAREIDQEPRDARFHFDNGNLIPIVTSQEGRALDTDATVKAIEEKFAASSATAQGRLGGAASVADSALAAIQENTIPLSVKISKPDADMRDASKMGIKELVAQGVSNFKHSIPGRIANIRTATSSFDGIVIPPGGVFSFNKYLKDVVEANGYEDAYVIFGNRTVLGPGGGVCQVSSTLFRAAFFGGLPIVERWAHAYRVGYYEPPVGLDATVFAPDVDLKFKNDTAGYLLIEYVLDEKNTTLTFNLYGTKPNRTVKLVGPEETNKKPHGPDIYNDDPSLPKGTVKQVDFAVDGEDVTVYREVYIDGQLARRDKFFSRYAPWQAVFQRGTRE